ncbi:membrane-associated, eicosanoid/glutathione metabolism protein [Cladochytrium replicatum]|nr:membrane-associated, eicosanoid/glutathione metabolism protein [Cladochytrium replicatum]
MSGISVPISAFYSGILGLYALVLQFKVSGVRRRINVSLGDGTREILVEAIQSLHKNNFANIESKEIVQPFSSKYWEVTRAVRAHGNLIEAAPVTLLFAAIAEQNGASPTFLHVALATFFVARIIHAAGVNSPRGVNVFRPIGVLGSTLPLFALAVYNLYSGARAVFGV